MEIHLIPEKLRRHAISGRVEIATGNGGLPLIRIHTPWSTAEIYLHGAHIARFEKTGEAPLLFMSAKSQFAPGKAIRGGVPICFPWFGPRSGQPAHGFARTTEWQLIKTAATSDGIVTIQFSLPPVPGQNDWKHLRTEFIVTVADTLTMELLATNESAAASEIENCLHTYFHVGDISAVSVSGLQGTPFDDFASGRTGERKVENDPALRITRETNRAYPGNTAAVEICDEKLQRIIRVEKFHSASTIVWNPWTTQLMADFDPAEHRQMLCVESGNVKQDKISLAPGKTAALKVVLSSNLSK